MAVTKEIAQRQAQPKSRAAIRRELEKAMHDHEEQSMYHAREAQRIRRVLEKT
jgi:hypothetical protein